MNKLIYDNRIKFRFFRHFVFFLIIVFLFTYIFFVQNSSGTFLNTLWVTFINSLFFFAYAYITIFLLIPEYLIKRKVIWFMLLFLLVGIGLSAIKLVISDHIFYSSISPENMQRSGIMNLRFIVVNTKDMTFIVAFFCIAKYVKDYLYAESFRKKLEVQNKEAQSKLLQSQFDPHFLFNTINNLYALSLLHPTKTKEVITRIKIVLNYIIDESQKDFVELQQEVSLVENYIQLEKLRYGKRLKVEYISNGNLNSVRIPPMILFFLVENCFKHGSSFDAGKPWIKILVNTDLGKIVLVTENSKPKSYINSDLEENDGHGLKNLRKRLEILYSKKGYSLTLDNKDTSFKVNLELKETEIEIGRKKYR
ncbi:MAG: histidine kinase [Prolixibacteraceae bacterium]|nr:histidine kinase [Prolixibacteraceae bacterium]MBT6765501.1 histidine kinase [Prolixibacteraceae bacterium]MBT6997046.1 histidine kinase [Prolixibacteraceae bacterium]MBT7396899.1 histidine kinase [Prolixibacteraceae bacterium]